MRTPGISTGGSRTLGRWQGLTDALATQGITLHRLQVFLDGFADGVHLDLVFAGVERALQVGADPFEPQALFVHGDPPKAGTL